MMPHKLRAIGTLFAVSAFVFMAGHTNAKATVTFMYWTTAPGDTESFAKITKAFEKEHPDIRIKTIAETWTGEINYFAKYLAMATAGVAPDTAIIPYNYIPNFAEGGLLEELGPYVKKGGFNVSDYSPKALQASQWKNRLWGLGAGGSDFWVFYNKKIMDESGVTDPGTLMSKGEWNWDAMESIMAKTSRFNGQKLQRIGYNQMADVSAMGPWVYGMGGRIMDGEGLRCTLDEQPAINAISRIRDNIYTRRIMGLSWAPPYNLDHLNSGKQEKYAMLGWWNSMGDFLISNKMPWKVDMVPFPAGPVDADDNLTTVHSVCMSKQSKVKSQAWEFIRFLGGAQGQMMCTQEFASLPSHKDVIRKLGDIYKSKGFTGGQFVQDAFNRLRPMERATKYNNAQPKMVEGLNRIWAGNANVAQILKETARVATVELARGAKKK